MFLYELFDGCRYLCLPRPGILKVVGDILGHIPRPALSGVESNDADRRGILALEQVADQRSAIGLGFIRFAPGAAKPAAEIIEDEIDVSAEGVRYTLGGSMRAEASVKTDNAPPLNVKGRARPLRRRRDSRASRRDHRGPISARLSHLTAKQM